MWQSWINVVIGLLLVVCAFAANSLGLSALAWITGVGGAVVAILAFLGVSQKKG